MLAWLASQDLDTFPQTLSGLFDEHASVMTPLAPNGKEAFMQDVVRLTRYAMRRRGDPGHHDYAGRLHLALTSLQTLMKACLLREAGFSADEIVKLFKRNTNYRFLQGMAQKSRQ